MTTLTPTQPQIQTQPKPFWVVAHRGVRTDANPQRMAPENTLPAFQEAARQGAAIELDVMSTADGRVIVHHDSHTGRIFQLPDELPGKPKPVAQTPWATLKAARLNASGHEVSVDKMLGRQGRYQTPETFHSVQISELQEVLDAVPDTHIFVELKPSPEQKQQKQQKPGLTAAVLKTIQDKHAQDRVTLISFDSQSLRQAKKLDPTVKTALNCTIPTVLKNNRPFLWAYTHLFTKGWLRADGIQPDYNSATPALIKNSHSAGLQVVPWVYHQTRAEEAAAFPQLLASGVDGLITNAVDLLNEAVQKHQAQQASS